MLKLYTTVMIVCVKLKLFYLGGNLNTLCAS